MPQVYHHSASQGNAFAAIHWTDVNYRTFQNSLASLPVGNSNGLTVYWTNAIKPLVDDARCLWRQLRHRRVSAH